MTFSCFGVWAGYEVCTCVSTAALMTCLWNLHYIIKLYLHMHTHFSVVYSVLERTIKAGKM